MKKVLFLTLIFTQIIFGQEKALSNNELKTKISTYLSSSVANGYSGSILVAKDGEIIISEGYGWANRKHKIPNTSSIVFNIGSVTKQFTAAAILKLAEQNKLSTSDKISKFFEQVPKDKEEITIHQLLTHTSGVSPKTGGFRYHEASKEQFLKEFFEADLLTRPGVTHRYANANYILLTAIIELVSNQDYTTFLSENFWKPLGMKHTGYKSISFSSEQIAHGYYYNYSDAIWKDWGITQEHLPASDKHWYSIGKGDIYSTVNDLYKWHLALKTNTVLSIISRELFETPFAAENDEETSHYSYGWAIYRSKRGSKIVTHNGSNGYYFSNFIRFVEEDVVVIELSNVILGRQTESVAWNIANLVFNKDYTVKPVPKSVYELVYDFITIDNLEDSGKLQGFIEKNTGTQFNDKVVFNRIGFKLLEKENTPQWGLELLKLNVQLFPEDGNLWDSLGDAHYKYNHKEDAAKAYKKALALAPKENCHWCKNSTSKLSKL